MRKRLLILFFLGLIVAGGLFRADAAERNVFLVADRYVAEGRYSDAAAAYGEISRYASGARYRARALLFEGVTRGFLLGRPVAALACFEKILLLYPETPAAADALFQCGIIYYGQNRVDIAGNVFSEYVYKYPRGTRRISAEAWLARILPRMEDLLIRVLMAEGAERLSIGSEKNMTVKDVATGGIVFSGAPVFSISAEDGVLYVNGHPSVFTQVLISSKSRILTLDGDRFRGDFVVSLEKEGLQVVNHVPLEEYLYGIVPREMPFTWSGEALMAQAVASRSYALHFRAKNRYKAYDLAASMASQVYGGVDVEKASTNHAVDATRGQVMTFDDRIVAAYYHADSGGHTENARDVWNVDMPYLQGIPDRFSNDVSGSRWQCHLTFDAVAERLRKAGLPVGNVSRIRVLEQSSTGRVLRIQVTSDTGIVEVSGNHFRVNLDPTLIRSTCFRLTSERDGVFLSGRGFGHGVGMSQWGAGRMAETGFTYREILAYYYPGIAITDAVAFFRSS